MADITIYAIHGPDTDKLAGIITEMQQRRTNANGGRIVRLSG